jgi:hypothetical protein
MKLSNQIITDYMAGRIGDEYYEVTGEGAEYIGVVSGIDKEDKNLRYSLAKNDLVGGWSNVKYFDHFEREVPDEESDSDEGMERITDITQVRPGDTEVMKSGNRYKVTNVDESSTDGFLLSVIVPEFDGPMWLHYSEFAYALRPKPDVPTEPGLYFDSVKDVWELGGTLLRVSHRLVRFQGNFCVDSEVKGGGLEPDFAPYTRIDLCADNE